MASVNKVILVGNLGKDPDVRYAPNGGGDAITTITLATTETWKDKSSGEKREATEWHRVVFFRKLADIAGQYLKKGSQVYIEGSLKTRKWQDKDGQDRYTTEIVADEMKMLGSRQGSGDNSSDYSRERQAPTGGVAARSNVSSASHTSHTSHTPPPSSSGGLGDFEDDVPF